MASNFSLDPNCVATFTYASTYPDMTRLALLKSSCSGELCSNLPTEGGDFHLKSLTSGKVFSSAVWYHDEDTWHYPETDSTYTTAEGNGDWCYYLGDFWKGK